MRERGTGSGLSVLAPPGEAGIGSGRDGGEIQTPEPSDTGERGALDEDDAAKVPRRTATEYQT